MGVCMSLSKIITDYLKQNHVSFEILEHPLAYTAMEIADSQHVPGRQMVKSVIVKGDGNFFMCLLPAIYYIDLFKLKDLLHVKHVDIANEQEISKLFPDFEVGAEPPLGHLYNLPIYADKLLEEDEHIVFNAGSHTQMIKMKWRDYKKLAQPTMVDMGIHIQTLKGGAR